MKRLAALQDRLREAVADDETLPISLPASMKTRLARVRRLIEDGSSRLTREDRLVVKIGGQPPYEFALPPVATIGRDQANDLPLPSTFVSRVHCRLVKRDEMWLLEDLGARNQVYVNGRPQSGCVLCDGDIIELGDVSLLFLIGLGSVDG